MPDHRDPFRLVNALLPVFEQLPARQQEIFVRLMDGPDAEAASRAAGDDLAGDLEEARAHFRAKLKEMRPS